MANNLVVRLLMETGAFSTNIKTAEKQIRSFENGIGTAKKSITAFGDGLGLNISSLTKFGSVVGVAVASAQAFQKVMQHNDSLGDKYAVTMNKVNSQMDSFWNSVSQGHFSNFIKNWDAVNKRASEYTKALDDAGTYTPILNAQLEISQTKLSGLIAIGKDLTKTEAERLKAIKLANTELLNQFNIKKSILELEGRTAKTNLNKALAEEGVGGIGGYTLRQMTTYTNGQTEVERRLKQYRKRMEQYNAFNAQRSLGNSTTQFDGQQYTRAERDAFMKQYEWLPKVYKNWEAINNVVQKHSDIVADALKAYSDDEELNAWFNELSRTINNTEHRIEGSGKKIVNTIDNIKKKLKFEDTANAYDLDGVFSRTSIGSSQIMNNKSLFEQYRDSTLKKEGKTLTDTTGDWIKDYLEQMREFERITYRLEDSAINSFGNIGHSIADALSAFDNEEEVNKMANFIDTLTNGILDICDAMQNWSNISQQSAKAMASASNASSMATNAETMATLGSAQADAVKTVAEGAKQGAKLPFPANLAGISAGVSAGMAIVALIASLISQMSRFENGGIVGGNSFSGDNMLIRANSGEMVLNKHQQSNLFKMLNSGGGGSTVKFHIEGRELVGVLNNYSNKRGGAL